MGGVVGADFRLAGTRRLKNPVMEFERPGELVDATGLTGVPVGP